MSKWRLVPTEPSFTTLQRMHEAMFTDKWDGTQAVMIGAAYDAALEGAHANATADLISQAREEGRREGLEKAAGYMEARAVESDELEKLHADDGHDFGAYLARGAARERRDFASDFRALAQKEGKNG